MGCADAATAREGKEVSNNREIIRSYRTNEYSTDPFFTLSEGTDSAHSAMRTHSSMKCSITIPRTLKESQTQSLIKGKGS